MIDFKKQIDEDIRDYQINFSCIPNINKNEWAFNYWILDKLFYEDEELIEEKIIDYHDLGIDAFEIYEDTKDIYLIQNKYFSDTTPISAEYIKNDFLLRAITALENGTYKKSPELQNAFTKYKNHSDFTVYLQLFITNNLHCTEAEEYIKKFNVEHPKYHASIFYLDDIEEKYYGEIKQNKTDITVQIESVNKGTILNINSEQYKLANVIDAKYVFTPIVSVYRLYREALEKSYPIFDKNIREYLGNKGVNKAMYNTLLDIEDRKNFFYYNNGITIICDTIGKINIKPASSNNINASFEITNPQIVNGCQTVNTIYEALKNIDPANLEKDFKDTFVMLKILEIDKEDSYEDSLYQSIVKFNNSQNPIDQKTFVANASIFVKLQREFEEKGFLLLIKQSDKNHFSEKYKIITKLKQANSERLHRFGLSDIKKASDVYIPLEKFLQVINAFVAGGQIAYVKKSSMLKYGSEQYNTAINFIKNPSVTNNVMLDLYLFYKKAEKAKKDSEDGRTPIPYYLIDSFAKYECEDRNVDKIANLLHTSENIDQLIKFYSIVTKGYYNSYKEENGIDYNKMIKRPIDYNMLEKARNMLSGIQL